VHAPQWRDTIGNGGVVGILSAVIGKHVEEFANELAQSLAKRYPSAMEANKSRPVSEARLTKILEDVLVRAQGFQRENRLGMFGKAKLGNEFRWRLKELGYSDKFIEVATEGLMVYLARADRAPAEEASAGR
jgi:hypothetical protein